MVQLLVLSVLFEIVPCTEGIKTFPYLVNQLDLGFEIVPCTEGIKTAQRLPIILHKRLKLFPVPKGLRPFACASLVV